ncbi:MAG: flavodoxin domain-containing protein [Anaerolineae bacterium]|nr:flavodoxin domain-containing protein [Anaerolineae bacterium]
MQMKQAQAPASILVTYASRSGSTAGVAEAIAETLQQHSLEVSVQPMQLVHDVSPYHAVIAGSAIRMDRWLPEALDFLHRHQPALRQKPFAAFLVCLSLAAKSEARQLKARQAAHDWLQPVRELVPTVSEGLFAGALHVDKIPEWRYRSVLHLVKPLGILPEGDHRDWDVIRTWANQLPDVLI